MKNLNYYRRKHNKVHFRGDLSFHERKQMRTDYFFRFVFGWRQRNCSACSGSGYYDHNNSPTCSSCGGTGKETYNSLIEINNEH